MKTLQNFIAGKWVAASADDAVDDLNPAEPSDVLARIPLSSADDVDRAIAAPFAQSWPSWSSCSPVRRAR